MADHLTDEALQIVASLVERPAIGADLRLLEPFDHPRRCRLDLRVLLAQAPDVARQPRCPLQDLVVEPLGLLGDEDVLIERLPDLDHVLQDLGGPIGDSAGGRGRDGLLQMHEGVVQGLAPLPRLGERPADLFLFAVHRITVTGGCVAEQIR